jgi:hypothetical protein
LFPLFDLSPFVVVVIVVFVVVSKARYSLRYDSMDNFESKTVKGSFVDIAMMKRFIVSAQSAAIISHCALMQD